MILGVLGVTGYAIVMVSYLIFTPGVIAQPVAHLAPRTPLIFHAFFGAVALCTGAVQLLSKFREKFPKANIVFRKIYYTSVSISALFGFYIALHAQGGLVNRVGFGMLAVLWIYSIVRAIRADVMGDMTSFRIWIVRNYALTFAAVTLRLYIPILWSFYGFEPNAFNTIYATLGFLCWVPNIIFVEWFYLNKS